MRLIQQQDIRVVQNGSPDSQTLSHATRKGTYQVTAAGCQTDQLQHLRDTRIQRRDIVHATVKKQVFFCIQIAVQQREV
jgi:hypothetical protein